MSYPFQEDNAVDINPQFEKSFSRGLSRTSIISKDSGMGKRSKSKNVFQCPMEDCGRIFDRKYNMQIHIRKHTGEMPYQCRVEGCGVRFKWRSSLVNHNRKHKTGELPGAPDPSLEIKGRNSNGERESNEQGFRPLDRQSTAPAFKHVGMRHSGPQTSSTTVEMKAAIKDFKRQATAPQNYRFDFDDMEENNFALTNNQPTGNRVQFSAKVDPFLAEVTKNLQIESPPSSRISDHLPNVDFGQQKKSENPIDVLEEQFDASFNSYGQDGGLLDNDFIEQFNGALTCEFNPEVIEEVFDNHFATPVTESFVNAQSLLSINTTDATKGPYFFG